ncbi:alanine--tRNA ligase [Hydrogenophaga crassostreae]|uniref:Alanine--tRNA ligase n=1 Tax=Hydrogenophaga crassostreae TaxID=1763535 RepID=A0A167H4U9_9BURK|nr:alanine--tRNA ligase [Hydrogenophaga crassostreae]AOW15498.1 alanine--tRNA ligase [Hydrogenophaga crassostreae]OAD40285.1 alanine--tRNA ligase [Hydrogenophaga crassostreae]
MTSPASVADIRKTFLDFFASKGHTIVPSSGLVPGNDPTLMFTNSGMVQFKDVFLGTDKRPYTRATSVQACLRAGGKHNDLENVGYTARHHTFFEMLGNWSFGDYFKRESLKWAWELLTEVYKLPADRLLATVYEEDDEAYDIWTKEIGLPPERVIRIGDNKGGRYKSDNFWMMADTGPCGPCSEIFYDHGDHIAGGPPGSPDEDGDRFIEIWNNVFMQFDMAEDGSVKPLPAPCVDTGMGLERLAAILQHVHSNYEIDIFDQLIEAAARETGVDDLSNPSLKVIADHIRATAFLVSDGVIPSNEGRGYVQRRIIRRAIRHGYKLGKKTPFFHKLVADLVKLMGAAYPSLANQEQRITDVLKTEEERFFETLATGMEILDSALAGGVKQLPGEVAFKLHDTYGFPLDLSADVCRERDLSVDEAGFHAAMAKQKAAGRAAGKFKMDKALEYAGAGNEFVGYEKLEAQAKVVALYLEGTAVAELKAGQNGVVVLDTTPFYAESGGQVGDEGAIVSGSAKFAVGDTQKIKADVFGHHGTLDQGTLAVGDSVTAQVDTAQRAATMRNHSVTHLMHKALREVLGDHVTQKGSLVDADKTRFDFTHNAPVTDDQIREIEQRVNAEIVANAATQARVMDIESAQKTGATMLFGEKYGETVRVLDIGTSRELCGGTHVARTGDIGFFTITAEGGVAAGVRRVEAVTGMNALNYVQGMETTLGGVAGTLKVTPHEVPARVVALMEQMRDLEKEMGAIKSRLASAQGDELVGQAVDVNGIKVLAVVLPGADAKGLRETMDKLKDKLKTAAIVLAAVDGDKVQIAAGVTADSIGKVKAGELVNFVAQQVGGKGGGKPDMAMAGGTDASGLPKALASVQAWVAERV